jgi:hypothetical protein
MSTETDRPRLPLRNILIAFAVTTILHYTDNYFRFDRYPQASPPSIHKAMIWQAWLIFTAFGMAGYLLYRRGNWKVAGLCLAVYSISGLISPLHYRYGSLSDFDVVQHVFILADGILGLAVLGSAFWLMTVQRRPALT